jgi:hypothetical protein
MNEDGPVGSPYTMKSTDELLSILSTRSDAWYNLGLILPRLYTDGFERVVLEEIINVSPARQEAWIVAGAVFHSLQVKYFASSNATTRQGDSGQGEWLVMHERCEALDKV